METTITDTITVKFNNEAQGYFDAEYFENKRYDVFYIAEKRVCAVAGCLPSDLEFFREEIERSVDCENFARPLEGEIFNVLSSQNITDKIKSDEYKFYKEQKDAKNRNREA